MKIAPSLRVRVVESVQKFKVGALFKHNLWVLPLTLILKACGSDTGPVQIIDSNQLPIAAAVNDLAQALRDGKPVEVLLNRANHINDTGWQGAADPLGTLQAGQNYVLTYNNTTGEFSTVGLHEQVQRNWVAYDASVSLNNLKISLWGQSFELTSEDSLVLLKVPQFGVVGEARIINAPSIDQMRSSFEAGLPIFLHFNQYGLEMDSTQTGGARPGWSGSSATDPLGTFLMGQGYTLAYLPSSNQFVVTGLNEATGTTLQSSTPRILTNGFEADLSQNKFNAWGWGFKMFQAPHNKVLFKCLSGNATPVCEDLNLVGEIR